MTTTKYYLSGPMTGLPNFNKPEFFRIANELEKRRIPVTNPADLDADDSSEKTWVEYLRRDLLALLDGCHAVAVLTGWEKSKGATLECAVAAAMGMPIVCANVMLCNPDRVNIHRIEPTRVFRAFRALHEPAEIVYPAEEVFEPAGNFVWVDAE